MSVAIAGGASIASLPQPYHIPVGKGQFGVVNPVRSEFAGTSPSRALVYLRQHCCLIFSEWRFRTR